MINCLIVGHDPEENDALKGSLELYFSQIKSYAVVSTIGEALAVLRRVHVELIFLDLREVGFEFLQLFPERNFEAVILAENGDFALKAYQEDIAYYLTKPVRKTELVKGVNRALDGIMLKRQKERSTVMISGTDHVEALIYTDINFIQSSSAYSRFHTDGRVILSSKNIGYYEDLLPKDQFIRTHHSYIVNIRKIARISKKNPAHVVLSNGEQIPISQRKLSGVIQHITANRLLNEDIY